jgi:hypothetical protein
MIYTQGGVRSSLALGWLLVAPLALRLVGAVWFRDILQIFQAKNLARKFRARF